MDVDNKIMPLDSEGGSSDNFEEVVVVKNDFLVVICVFA